MNNKQYPHVLISLLVLAAVLFSSLAISPSPAMAAGSSLTINVATPTTATIGTPYTLLPTVSGGTSPYSWSTTGKPSWLMLNPNTGVLSGTPGTSAKTVTFTLQVKDKKNLKATANVTININQPTPPVISINSPTTATIGSPFTLTPTASGGAGAPYSWSTTGKPFWLMLDQNTGAMTGTPGTSAVSVTFTLQVKDKIGTKATKNVTINISQPAPPTITVDSPTTATIGSPFTLTPTASGGAGAPYSWSTTGKPFWLTLDQNTGAMTGTPGVSAVTVTFILQVKDKIGTKATANVTINVITAPTDPLVTFPDPNLEAAIRQAINKPAGDIHTSELTALKTLMADYKGISNLSGLEYCQNVSYLRLTGNNVSDMVPLKSLTNLTHLFLSNNQISNLTPLAGLIKLNYLFLSNNPIRDITPLGQLANLTNLGLENNLISDLTPLASLTNLTELYIIKNQINDLTPLSNLNKLTVLRLYSNQINNLTPLVDLPNLIYLDLAYNQISDISPLVDNTGLSSGDNLNLKSNPLNSSSISSYIPALQARGVRVEYDLPIDHPKAVILVDTRLYNLLKNEIDQYRALAQVRRGFSINLDIVNNIDDWSYTAVRDRIKSLKDENPDLEGVLLMGNIKMPSFFQSRGDNIDLRLMPHYFEDLDAVFRKDLPNGSQIPFGGNSVAVPVHDLDFIGKGPNPDPELWAAFMPVGSAGTQNTYNDFAAQLRPYLEKVIRFYSGEIKTNGRYYYVSRDKGERMDLNWETFGKSNIDYYGMAGPNGETGSNCMKDGINVCYVRWPLESYTSYADFVADWEARDPGEGWQQDSIFLSHMASSIYSIVQVNVHSNSVWSLVSTAQARGITGGGLIVALDGCGVAGMSQPGSPSVTDGQGFPSENVLLAFLYGNSQAVAGSGDPFTRGHYANHPTVWSRLVTFGDYLGKAHLERMKVNYASSDSASLREWSMEMLVGDPFVDLQDISGPAK
ncbi:MAG: putative Ig domain-containing protein [Dehalococcoidia bacterium]|nr:putative Ig domain-containing protein [Dehalococcoidia bacterium]MDD5495359.1 putative Ig domain-containing protein [Dehalococcoidia bacterium]